MASTPSEQPTTPPDLTSNGQNHGEDPTRWTIYDERILDDTRGLRPFMADVEPPDWVTFQQYVLRMPAAAMTVVLDDAGEHAVAAGRDVEEETGWRSRNVGLLSRFQPLTGSADFENLIYLSEGAEGTGSAADINEAARVEWVALADVPRLVAENEIIGATAQVSLWQVLATRRNRQLWTSQPPAGDALALLPAGLRVARSWLARGQLSWQPRAKDG